jgi:hypothetical protein
LHAAAVIQVTPLAAPLSLDEAQAKALEEAAVREVPPGSASVELVSVGQNPVALGGHPSVGFVLSYTALGRTSLRNVIYVLCPENLLMFQLTAEEADFKALDAGFRRSISSWHWI